MHQAKKYLEEHMFYKFILVAIVAFFIVGFLMFVFGERKVQEKNSSVEASALGQTTPQKEKMFEYYTSPKIAAKPEYTIFLVGDSMTHALGPHGGTFNTYINNLYRPGQKGILIDNYAAGATNILSLEEAMNKETVYWDSTFAPLLSRDFDLILIESFGYNPLSQYPLEEGLKKQTEMLDKVMGKLTSTHPDSAVVFVATISPNRQNYSLPVNPNTTLAERTSQAEERIAYIKNHIAYAESHNIPVVNIFEKSLNESGDGDLRYINPDDYIHPSFEGVDFIGRELADFIYENNILPH